MPQPVSRSVLFKENGKLHPFFQQNKIQRNKQLTRSQPQKSEDEDYFNQNQQHYNNIPRKKWNNFDQPDKIYKPNFFKFYMNSENRTKKTRQ